MKTKNVFLLAGLALSGLVWNGCYTQIARPDREEDTQVARESETTDEESAEVPRRSDDDERYADERHVTNVYVDDDFWWGWRRPYWAYSPRYGYRYPRSRFYVSAGYGYYDPYYPQGWCGTPWSWCDPWDDYYSGYGGPYSHWGPYYDPFYYPRQVNRDRVVEQRKRTITRRGSSPADDNSGSPGTYGVGGSRGSLARPVAGTYARGDDGSYRRVRRTDVTRTTPSSTTEAPNVIDRDNGNTNDSGRRTVRRTNGDGGDKTVVRRPSSDGNSSGGNRTIERRGRKEPPSSGGNERRGSGGSSGGSVSRPSGSSGKSSPPPSSGGSSGNSGSSERRRRN